MTIDRLRREFERIRNTVHRFLEVQPGARELWVYIHRHKGESLYSIALLWWPVVMRLMGAEGHEDEPSRPEMERYLKNLAKGARPGPGLNSLQPPPPSTGYQIPRQLEDVLPSLPDGPAPGEIRLLNLEDPGEEETDADPAQ